MLKDKPAIRQYIWDLLTQREVARFPGAHGRIPNFVGAEGAARRLATLPEWRSARVIKANPDSPQRPVRLLALQQGKIVYMAVPRLGKMRPFIELDPARLPVPPQKVATIKGAFRWGRPVRLEEMQPVDLVVAGSVAVARDGARVGKGGGYSDLEYALARQAGLLGSKTPVVTTVHSLQVVDFALPMTRHDVCLSHIITPQETVVTTQAYPQPEGIHWDDLEEEKLAAIPLLREFSHRRGNRPTRSS